MALYLDISYLRRLSYKLDRFVEQSPRLFNCRCPYCGDSQKNKRKARGYLFPGNNHLIFKCHNCGKSTAFGSMLKELDPPLYLDYRKESIALKPTPIVESTKTRVIPNTAEIVLSEHFVAIVDLPEDDVARRYVVKRKIPQHFWADLWKAPTTKAMLSIHEKYKDRHSDEEPRLVIPFRDIEGHLVGISGRVIPTEESGKDSITIVRYWTMKFVEDKNVPMIYGLERVDFDQPVFVTEGPLDSMFLHNAIAVGGSDLRRVITAFPEADLTFIFDNQPRNKELHTNIQHIINAKHKLMIWPKSYAEKDLNELVEHGMKPHEVQEFVNALTFSSLSAEVHFNHWRQT